MNKRLREYQRKGVSRIRPRVGEEFYFCDLPVKQRKWGRVRTRPESINAQALGTFVALVLLVGMIAKNLLTPMIAPPVKLETEATVIRRIPNVIYVIPIAVLVIVGTQVKQGLDRSKKAKEEMENEIRKQESILKNWDFYSEAPHYHPHPTQPLQE